MSTTRTANSHIQFNSEPVKYDYVYSFEHFLNSLNEQSNNNNNTSALKIANPGTIYTSPKLMLTKDPNSLSTESPVMEELFKEKVEKADLESKIEELMTDLEKEKDYSKELENNVTLIKTKYEKDLKLVELANLEKDKIIKELEDTVAKQNELNNSLMQNIENYGGLIEKMKATIEALSKEKSGKSSIEASGRKNQDNQSNEEELLMLRLALEEKDKIIKKLSDDMGKNIQFLEGVKKLKEELMGYGQKIQLLVEEITKKNLEIEDLKNKLLEEKAKNEKVSNLLANKTPIEGKSDEANDNEKINYFKSLYEDEMKKKQEAENKINEQKELIQKISSSNELMKESYEKIINELKEKQAGNNADTPSGNNERLENFENAEIEKLNKENEDLKNLNSLLLSKIDTLPEIENKFNEYMSEIDSLRKENIELKEKLGISVDINERQAEVQDLNLEGEYKDDDVVVEHDKKNTNEILVEENDDEEI